MKSMHILVALSAAVVLVGVRGAQAVPVTIVNPGFESPSLGANAFSQAGVSGTTPTGWDFTGSPVNGGGSNPRAGHYNGSVTPLTSGDEVAWAQNGGNFRQVLTDTLQAGVYTLTVQVGDLSVSAFPGYNVQLLAGSTIIGQDNNTLTPVSQFLTSTVIANIPFGDVNLGQVLSVRFAALTAAGEAEFNNVTLDFVAAVPAPEPNALLLLVGLGIAARGRLGNRRRG